MEKSPLSKNRTFYSYSSAYNVVSAFIGKWGRATMICAKTFNIPYHKFIMKMVHYFRYDQKRWYALKKTIKTVEIMEYETINYQILKEYLSNEKQNYIKEQIKEYNLEKIEKFILDIDKVFDIEYICQG